MDNKAYQVGAFVQRKLRRITDMLGEPAAKADLAKMRRGIGKTPGSMPELWQATFEDMPDDMVGGGSAPSYAEWAVYTVLTLFALHQQGKDPKTDSVHREGVTLGDALRRLAAALDNDKRVKPRFDAMATATDMTGFATHLRGLVQLLKANDIPLDYVSLASDIYRFQFADSRDGVCLNWGRAFYRSASREETESNSDK